MKRSNTHLMTSILGITRDKTARKQAILDMKEEGLTTPNEKLVRTMLALPRTIRVAF